MDHQKKHSIKFTKVVEFENEIDNDEETNITIKTSSTKHRYSTALQSLIPIRLFTDKNENPQDTAGCLSNGMFSWLTSLIFKMYKTQINAEDLWEPSRYDEAQKNYERLAMFWDAEVSKVGIKKASLNKVTWRFLRTRVLISLFLSIIFSACIFASSSIIMQKLLACVSQKSSLAFGLLLIGMLLVVEITRVITLSFVLLISYRTAVRCRGALLLLLFKKVTRLPSTGNNTVNVSELINMCSNDGDRILDANCIITSSLLGPILLFIGGTAYIVSIIGTVGLLGSAVFIVLLLLQAILAKVMMGLRVKALEYTEKRVDILNEVFSSIKLIKMYAWEKPFSEMVLQLRNKELSYLRITGFLVSVMISTAFLTPVIASVVLFSVMFSFNMTVTAQEAFTCIAIFNTISHTMKLLPLSLRSLADANVALDRFKKVLTLEDIKSKPAGVTVSAKNSFEIVSGEFSWMCTGEQEDDDKQSLDSRQDGNDQQKLLQPSNSTHHMTHNFHLKVNSFITRKGHLVGIYGNVGSGKSSFISALMGHMKMDSGSIRISGAIAYCSQQAVLFNVTVRENILFGCPYDETKYKKVVKACNLEEDFKALCGHDLTEVGEQGVNMSGGQKQRISLARALYSDRDIYLLDDPLSAVDAHVGKHIFMEAILEYLKNRCKTVVFITHQVQYLTYCDKVYAMDKGVLTEESENGKDKDRLVLDLPLRNKILSETFNDSVETLCFPGSPAQLPLTPNKEGMWGLNSSIGSPVTPVKENQSVLWGSMWEFGRSRSISSFSDVTAIMDSHSKLPSLPSISASKGYQGLNNDEEQLIDDGRLMSDEDRGETSISFGTYATYIKAAGGWFATIAMFLFFIVNVGAQQFSNFWLSYWLNQTTFTSSSDNFTYNMNESSAATNIITTTPLNTLDTDSDEFYENLLIYGISAFTMFLISIIRGYAYVSFIVRACRNLHKDLFTSVLNSSMKFFDTNPTGRIINRFQKDMDEADIAVPSILEMFLFNLVTIFFCIGLITYVFPAFLVLVGIVFPIYVFAYLFFKPAARQMKLLDALTRSPWFAHLSTTVTGMDTIRAYNQVARFTKDFCKYLDGNGVPYHLFMCINRWLGVRLDLLTIAISVATAAFVIFNENLLSPSFAGLALSTAFMFNGLLQFTTRVLTELTARFVSVDRIKQYIDSCPQESDCNTLTAPPEWPLAGQVEFSDVVLKYRPDLPNVLKNLSFTIKAGEKVGIVGRTGAGKSSMSAALFRLVEICEGKILIDNVDIATVPLSNLRSSLSVIPQDPTLFSGTIRYNLDPFNQHTDEKLMEVLDSCQLKDSIMAMGLDAEIMGNGNNFSVGEKQLICLARTLLKRSKVLLLDEATSAVDADTEHLIHHTIDNAFHRCTVIMIAHRLTTVLACDRVMVLDDGNIVEFDSPTNLRDNTSSRFAQMLEAYESGLTIT